MATGPCTRARQTTDTHFFHMDVPYYVCTLRAALRRRGLQFASLCIVSFVRAGARLSTSLCAAFLLSIFMLRQLFFALVVGCRPSTVLLYVGKTIDKPWTGTEARSGALGGSETNAGELAAALHARGYSVVVSGQVQDGDHDGVQYVSEQQLKVTDWLTGAPQFDHIIISRVVQQFQMNHRFSARRGIFLWVQDIIPSVYSSSPRSTRSEYLLEVEQLLSGIASSLTRVLALSPSHKADMARFFPTLHASHPQLWSWMPNAIDAGRWERAETAFAAAGEAKIPHRFIYTSVPNRGLSRLLRLFPRVRAALPGATLVVSTYEPEAITEEMHRLLRESSEYVTFAGALSKADLYREMLRAEVWLYPTTFKETYCNTALEMMRGRVLAVASDLGALHDWLGASRGVLLPMVNPDRVEGSELEYGEPKLDLEALVALLADRPRLKHMVDGAHAWAVRQTWERRSEQWARLLESASSEQEDHGGHHRHSVDPAAPAGSGISIWRTVAVGTVFVGVLMAVVLPEILG